jgi:hypothetical protein
MLKEYVRHNKKNFNPEVIERKVVDIMALIDDLPVLNVDNAAQINEIQADLKDILNCLYNRNPIGVLISDKVNGQVVVGFSLCNKRDRYTKKEAESRAIDRMNEGAYKIPESVQKHFKRFLRRSEKYFLKDSAKTE